MNTPVAAAVSPAELARSWPAELVHIPLVILDRADSTQSVARRILDRLLEAEEEAGPLFVVALEQSAGRGRRGRHWASPAAEGLYASFLFPVERSQLGSLPGRTAVALVEALARWLPGIGIKWPNDLMHGGRKLAGVLIEVVSRGAEALSAIVGFGVNVGRLSEPSLQGTATSLGIELQARSAPALGEVLAACAGRLSSELLGTPGAWIDRYRQLSVHVPGQNLRIEIEGETLVGRFLGLDASASVRLALPSGERIVTSGDVFSW